jgi:hypothetical protein
VDSASTIVSADTPTWRVVEGDDMTGCNDAETVETCHMVMSAITQLPGHRVAGGDRLDHLDFLRRLGTSIGRR